MQLLQESEKQPLVCQMHEVLLLLGTPLRVLLLSRPPQLRSPQLGLEFQPAGYQHLGKSSPAGKKLSWSSPGSGKLHGAGVKPSAWPHCSPGSPTRQEAGERASRLSGVDGAWTPHSPHSR